MEIGILGLPRSGKSTLFEIMTGIKNREMHKENYARGQAAVSDERFNHLVNVFKPAKVSPAKVPFIDVNAVGEHAWDSLRRNLSGVEGILHIVDGFSVSDVGESIVLYHKLEDEMTLSDLMIVENRVERLVKTSKKSLSRQDISQVQLMPKLKEHLEKGKPLRELSLAPEEIHSLRSFSFWTIRPELAVINVAEDNFSVVDAFQKQAALSVPVMGICCLTEAELAVIPQAEQKEYLAAIGVEEPAYDRIIRASFSLLGRIVYFTYGFDEVKSWVIPAGTKAPQAAAVIHNDFERGFIKAEVVSFEEFKACDSNISAVKSSGKMRLEGKEYIVRDGDIITFRFNV
jgi:GTP-binding protein YchF